VTDTVQMHRLGNGMVILAEPMKSVESVAFCFLLPAGAAVLPEGFCGAANVAAEWIFRGAGERDNRQLGDALDGLGLHRSSSVGTSHISIAAALESSNLAEALKLYADVILSPRLCEAEFEPVRQLAIEAVKALDDDPRQKVALEVRQRFYPSPLGRSTVGDIAQLRGLDCEGVRRLVRENFDLSRTILAVAGNYDFDRLVKEVEALFGAESPGREKPLQLGEKGQKYTHIHNPGAQVHIGVMTGTVTPDHGDYYDARMAVGVLSGGMSSRLFTEVREKRGLCYAVGARYHGLKQAAGIICYAGTVPEKAQETLDVVMEQFSGLSGGIDPEEIERARVGLKSSLIMQSESTSNRASAIAADYYILGRVRSIAEIEGQIDRTSVGSVEDFLRRNRFEDFTVVTIGPEQVSVE